MNELTAKTTYPGAALTHRFLPSELSKQETPDKFNLASKVNFKPVATLQTNNQSILIRPVQNTRSRAVSPLAASTPQIILKSEKVVSLTPQLHSSIQAKAAASTERMNAVSLPQAKVEPRPAKPEDHAYNEQIKNQLEEINKLLYEQIKQKVAWELNRQKTQVQQNPEVDKTQTAPAKPEILTNQVNKDLPKVEPAQVSPNTPVARPVQTKSEPDYKQHIVTLEKEIGALQKEILNLEKMIHLRLAEKESENFANLENKVKIDEKMIRSVADWRESLNQLVDSHTTAIKYLKKKTDWAEDEIEVKLDHKTKHHKLHRKPKGMKMDFAEMGATFSPLDSIATNGGEQIKKVLVPNLPINVTQPTLNLGQQPATVNQPVVPPSPAASTQAKIAVEPSLPASITFGQRPGINSAPQINIEANLPTKAPNATTLSAGLNITGTPPKSGPELNLTAFPRFGSNPEAKNAPTIQTSASLTSSEAKPGEASLGKVAFAPNSAPTGPVVGQVAVSENASPVGQNIGNVGVAPNVGNKKELGSLGLNADQAKGENFGQIGVAPLNNPVISTPPPSFAQTTVSSIPNPAQTNPQTSPAVVFSNQTGVNPTKIVEQRTVVVSPEKQTTQIINQPTERVTSEEASRIQAQPGQSTFGPVVEQHTVIVKPDKATVVEPEKKIIEEQKVVQEVIKPEVKPTGPSLDEIKSLIKEAMNQATQDSPKEVNVVGGKTGQSVEKEFVAVKKVPSEKVDSPLESVTSIEKQILEAAEKAEAAKEVIQKETEARRKEQEEKKLQAAGQAISIKTNVPTPTAEISPSTIDSSITKLKTDLTTINQSVSNLSPDDRKAMIHKLQTLEKENEVAKHIDQLKASQERRKINQELQNMLHAFHQERVGVPSAATTTTQIQPPRAGEQIETLKQEEKTKTTPIEKAKIIAEIKELERSAQARKQAELNRPTIKAQPAFGKMLPNTPTIPNVINGIVKDNRGLLLPTVVIIVKDQNGDPVRAFKTNKIGQFALSTAVPNGTYTLELEKEGYDFDIIEVDVDGSIMKPIEIKAK